MVDAVLDEGGEVSDTPETDSKANDTFGNHLCATVLADFARKLERERDEAREQNAKLRNIAERLADELRDLANPAFDEILNEFEELKLKEGGK